MDNLEIRGHYSFTIKCMEKFEGTCKLKGILRESGRITFYDGLVDITIDAVFGTLVGQNNKHRKNIYYGNMKVNHYEDKETLTNIEIIKLIKKSLKSYADEVYYGDNIIDEKTYYAEDIKDYEVEFIKDIKGV